MCGGGLNVDFIEHGVWGGSSIVDQLWVARGWS